jgi:hypothetical protein
VKAVFPDANIVANRIDSYPIKVTVTAYLDDGRTAEVWTGRQQSLFRKNGAQRKKSIQEIQSSLQSLMKTSAL